MYLFAAFTSATLAAHLSVSETTPSPLGDQDSFLEQLAPWCGAAIESVTYGHIRDVKTQVCDIWFDAENGNFTARVVGKEQPSRQTPLTAAALDQVTASDWQVFVALGFDPAEAEKVRTHEVVFDEWDLRSGQRSAERYVETKTFFFRTLDGLPAGADRIVITRDVDGSLRSVTGAWPDFSGSTVIRPDGESLDPETAAYVIGVPEAEVERLVLHSWPEHGWAETLVVVDAASPLVRDETAHDKITSHYFIDGVLFDPLEEEAWFSFR